MVVPRGIDPRSSPYRGEALPLSYGTNLVRLAGVEPAASAMSTRRSSVELEARAPGPIRTDEMSVCKTDAFGHLATRANWCAGEDSNFHCAAFEAAASYRWATSAYPRRASNPHFPAFKAGPLPVGLRGRIGAPGGIRTRTVFLLREAPPASWATDAKMVLPASLELASPPYQSGDLPHDREERIGARSIELNVHLSRYKPEALPVELCGHGAGGRS